jgi:hypothetical protein
VKRAVVTLPIGTLEDFLDLPKGVHLAGVRDNWHSLGIDLLLEGAALPVDEHAPGTAPPQLYATQEKRGGKIKIQEDTT